MRIKKQKSFNSQIYQKAYKRLKLNPIDRTIFQRLLGFFIRNDKPFPFSVVAMSELTGYSKSTIFRSLNNLEHLRLIARKGFGKNRKFIRGSILCKIFTTVSNRINNELNKYSTTVSHSDKKLTNRVTVTYKKTSLSLKHKEGVLTQTEQQEKLWYLKNPHIPVKKEHMYLFET